MLTDVHEHGCALHRDTRTRQRIASNVVGKLLLDVHMRGQKCFEHQGFMARYSRRRRRRGRRQICRSLCMRGQEFVGASEVWVVGQCRLLAPVNHPGRRSLFNEHQLEEIHVFHARLHAYLYIVGKPRRIMLLLYSDLLVEVLNHNGGSGLLRGEGPERVQALLVVLQKLVAGQGECGGENPEEEVHEDQVAHHNVGHEEQTHDHRIGAPGRECDHVLQPVFGGEEGENRQEGTLEVVKMQEDVACRRHIRQDLEAKQGEAVGAQQHDDDEVIRRHRRAPQHSQKHLDGHLHLHDLDEPEEPGGTQRGHRLLALEAN
mmetsp:Transcript_86568/g.242486  ORF Transcript_86568/g.242486 Transcript_86568/m.242486 type:complete len:317 (-) Transcript_86568:1113-2063(-)